MADERFIWVEVDEDNILKKFDFFFAYHREYARGVIDNSATFGVNRLHAGVPQKTTYLLRHVDREAVRWMPGGPDGGGEWGTIVGIKAGTSLHPLYAEQGTGLYATPSRGYIQPTTRDNMTFFSQLYGHVIKVKRIRGQRPQRYFYAA